MKFTALVLPLLATALTVSAGSQVHLSDSDELDVPGDNPLTFCSDPKDYILDIDEVYLDPNPPKAGQNLTINAKGTLSKAVRRGTFAHIQVKYGLIKILDQNVNICNEAGNVDMKCPLEGEIELKKVVALPKEIPPGRYNVIANVTTPADDLVTCLQASVPFNLPGSMMGNEL